MTIEKVVYCISYFSFRFIEYFFDEQDLNDATKRYLISETEKDFDEVYNLFKESGDKALIPYETICSSDICSYKGNSKFYGFVGDNSRNYCLIKFMYNESGLHKMEFCSGIGTLEGVDTNEYFEPKHRGDFPF